MMFSQSLPIKHIPILILLLFTHISCANLPPRVDDAGKPQREYTYHVPLQIDDGWPVAALSEEGVNEAIIDDMMTAILAGNYPNLISIVLIRNGSLILEEFLYYNNRYWLQEFRSAGKSLTSVLMGIAFDSGFIKGMDEKLFDFFPAFEKGDNWDRRKEDVTLHHVLSMRWGFDESGPSNKLTWYSENWISKTLSLPLVSEPGEKFEYHSAAPALCGPILESMTGMPVKAFAKAYLFDPLQISDYLWHTMADGSTLTAGGMFMRPRDMAKIGYLILNRGQWHGRQIVSEKWIDSSTRPYTSDDEMGYGYYWWLSTYKGGDQLFETIFAAGHGGQRVMVVPELNLVAVFTSKPDENPKGHKRIIQIMEKYILPSMLASGS